VAGWARRTPANSVENQSPIPNGSTVDAEIAEVSDRKSGKICVGNSFGPQVELLRLVLTEVSQPFLQRLSVHQLKPGGQEGGNERVFVNEWRKI
jgi:hypothetical protein